MLARERTASTPHARRSDRRPRRRTSADGRYKNMRITMCLSEMPAMFRILALLCLVAASALRGPWQGGLRVRFDMTVHGIGTTAFIELPQSVDSAVEAGWKQFTGPPGPEEYQKLSLFCPEEDCTVCVLFDDTDYIAGLQVALDEEKYYDNIFDWTVQGFTPWTVEINGKIINSWTIRQYYITPETLATDPATRIAQRNPNLMLQDHSILVSGFNRELYRISTNVTDIADPNNGFTEQACIPWMGNHYYYKMTEELECNADTLFPFFPLVHSDQLIGIGLVAFGKHTVNEGERDWFETPSSAVVQAIVPRGPQCLYDLADSPGLITMHTYFIQHPYEVICEL